MVAENNTARRAAAHKPNRASNGLPAIGSRPVQFGIAVSRNPRDRGADKSEQHLVPMPGDRLEAGGKRELAGKFAQPQRNCDDRPSGRAEKEGPKPPAQERVGAAMRFFRSASICSPRVGAASRASSPVGKGSRHCALLQRVVLAPRHGHGAHPGG